jgi:pimeloyl-ACP methyl ester carboxylesterase
MVSKGVTVFVGLKRGIRHVPKDDTFTTDLAIFSQADLPHLKSDALAVFESFQKDPRVDAARMSVWGGSEGTILAAFIATRHPEIKEVSLASSMIESFPTLFARQMYEILPRQLIAGFDKNGDGVLSRSEITDEYFSSASMNSFTQIDANHDGSLSASDLASELKRVIETSLRTGDDKFFLSDLGGRVTTNWVKSAMTEEPLGPQILSLKMPMYVYHGTADENTLVQPVHDLQILADRAGKNNIRFTYFQGLAHELSRGVIAKTMLDSADRISK